MAIRPVYALSWLNIHTFQPGLLHGGSEVRRLGEKIMAVPWGMVTG